MACDASVRNKGGSGGVRPLQRYEGPMQSCNMWGPWVGPIKTPSLLKLNKVYDMSMTDNSLFLMKIEHRYNL